MGPFLGQGVCQALRDVANVVWKIRLILNGDAPEAYAARRATVESSLASRALAGGRHATPLARPAARASASVA